MREQLSTKVHRCVCVYMYIYIVTNWIKKLLANFGAGLDKPLLLPAPFQTPFVFVLQMILLEFFYVYFPFPVFDICININK